MKLKSICWQRVFEDSRIIKSLLNKVILVIADGYTKELCISAHLFTLQVVALVRKSGFQFVAFYLKLCTSSLQQAYGGDPKAPELLPVPVESNRKSKIS